MQKVRVLATACSIAKSMAGERPLCYCLFPSSVVNVLGMCGPGPALQVKLAKDALRSYR